MGALEETYQKKSDVEQKGAVKKYQVQEKKAHDKIYHAMEKQVPKRIREVIRQMIKQFREGTVSVKDCEKLLNVSFSDRMFS